MKKNLFPLVIVLFVALSFINVLGQEKTPGRTYKIYTHTIVGSNDSGNKDKLSNNMAKAFENVRDNFSYANYKLLSTQFQIIKVGGSLSYKSILNGSDLMKDADMPLSASWLYQSFNDETLEESKRVGFRTFNFSLTIPVRNIAKGLSKDVEPNYVFNEIGVTAGNVYFPIGTPTVFSSFPIEYSNKTLFFVIHIEEAK